MLNVVYLLAASMLECSIYTVGYLGIWFLIIEKIDHPLKIVIYVGG